MHVFHVYDMFRTGQNQPYYPPAPPLADRIYLLTSNRDY